MAKTKKMSPKRRLTVDERVERAQTGKKPKRKPKKSGGGSSDNANFWK